MNYLNQYPVVIAEFLSKSDRPDGKVYLFNKCTNKGFQLDNLAALLVQKFNGKRSLRELISELEFEVQADQGMYDNEIESLIEDLLKNELIEFREV